MTDHTVPLSDEFKRRVPAYQGKSSSEVAALATPAEARVSPGIPPTRPGPGP